MAREHIEFVQAQVLPWEPAGDFRPGVTRKVLSHDPVDGAASLVLRYPAAWCDERPAALAAAEELYVLTGELVIGAVRYAPGDYAYLPPGFVRDAVRAGPQGAVVLTFFSAAPVSGGQRDADPPRLIRRLASGTMDWDSNVDPRVVGSNVAKKTLRNDPDSGDSTWILRIGPLDPADVEVTTPLEKHPYVEEMYQLDGEISTNVGVMRRGAYFWRPPQVSHGPIASRPGFLALFRSHGGARSTDWSAEEYPVVWDAPYRPVLPDSLRDVAYGEFDAARLY